MIVALFISLIIAGFLDVVLTFYFLGIPMLEVLGVVSVTLTMCMLFVSWRFGK